MFDVAWPRAMATGMKGRRYLHIAAGFGVTWEEGGVVERRESLGKMHGV